MGSLVKFSGLVLVMGGLISFMLNQGHLLNSLLSLEFMGLGLYWVMSLLIYNSMLFFCVFFLVMLVCESVLGLSLLVVSAWSHSSDYLNMFSMLEW